MAAISSIDKIKAYAFPTVLSILWMLLYRDITEMKSDIKMLLQQSSIDKTKIENLERMMYGKKSASMIIGYEHDKYFKHEDFFDINNYIL
jgi:hypothetical protein